MTNENQVRQGGNRGSDAARIATLSGTGAAIGAGAGGAVGLASVLLTRGREVELRQGSTIDVVFDPSGFDHRFVMRPDQ